MLTCGCHQYYTAKRALAPIALYGQRTPRRVHSDPTSAAEYVQLVDVRVGVSSSLATEVAADVEVVAFDLGSGKRIRHWRQQAQVRANRSCDLMKLELPSEYADPERPIVISATLFEREGRTILARLSLWPEPSVPGLSSIPESF